MPWYCINFGKYRDINTAQHYCKLIRNERFKIQWPLNKEELVFFFLPCAAHATSAAQQNASPASSQDHQKTGIRRFRNCTLSGDAKQAATAPPAAPPPGYQYIPQRLLAGWRDEIPHPRCMWAGGDFLHAASSELCVQMNKLGPTAFWLPL